MAAEKFTKFPVIEGDFFTPEGLYERVHASFRRPRNEVYFGGPASSGSFRRLVDPEKQVDDLRRQLVIGLNSQLALTWAEHSVNNFPDSQLTVAHLVGQSLEPKESNYNLYWLMHLTGVDPWFANQFVNFAKRQDFVEKINNHNGGPQREEAYIELSDIFFAMTGNISDLNFNPISVVVFLPDHRTSLGCRLERKIVTKLNELGFQIPMYEAVMNLSSPKVNQQENRLLMEAYRYIQQEGQPRLNGVPFTPPFVNIGSEEFIILKPLKSITKISNNHPLEFNDNLLRIHELSQINNTNVIVRSAIDLPTDCDVSVSAGVVFIDQLSFDPEKLVVAMLGLKTSDGRAMLSYPKLESGGMSVISLTISVAAIDQLWNACSKAMNVPVNTLKNL